MKQEDAYYMIIAMKRYGGSFVVQLANLLQVADSNNFAKLEDAFREYFAQYAEMAKKIEAEGKEELP